MRRDITHKIGRMEVTVSDVAVELKTEKGTFQFGVDNYGEPYISTGTTRLVIIPSASNRANVFAEARVIQPANQDSHGTDQQKKSQEG